MAKFDVTELEVCTVCICLIANGEYTSDPEAEQQAADGMARVWGEDARHLVPGGHVEDCDGTELCGCVDPWFSWSSCDGCGSGLGGDRHRAVALIPAEKTSACEGYQAPITGNWVCTRCSAECECHTCA